MPSVKLPSMPNLSNINIDLGAINSIDTSSVQNPGVASKIQGLASGVQSKLSGLNIPKFDAGQLADFSSVEGVNNMLPDDFKIDLNNVE